jgi:hypothetical protein
MQKIKTAILAAPALFLVAAGNVMAAVPSEVTTSLTAAKADGVEIATAVFVAIVVLFAFGLMRKALR